MLKVQNKNCKHKKKFTLKKLIKIKVGKKVLSTKKYNSHLETIFCYFAIENFLAAAIFKNNRKILDYIT